MVTRILPLLLGFTILSGCHASEEPRLRISSYFGSISGMDFPDPGNLGRHNYTSQWNEKIGMVYTCRGGFIDLGHLREAADRTYYASNLIYGNIMNGRKTAVFRVIEPSQYRLSIAYPSNWYLKSTAERQQIARDVATRLGQEIAHTSLVWHEIITWFGWASTGLFSEQISSFSWEDSYSDVLGTALAVKAMRQDRPFEEAMTDLIYEALRDLEVQPAQTARKALEQIEGEWFEGGMYFFVKMNKRNFDVGFENGQVMPWLVPGICSASRPVGCPAPKIQNGDLHGFTMQLTLDPVVHEKKKIYRLLALEKEKWLTPSKDFPVLLERIVQEARKEYGAQVDVPMSRHLVLRNRPAGDAGNVAQ